MRKKRCLVCMCEIPSTTYYCKKCQNVSLEDFGAYRMGLTFGEIEEYLHRRLNRLNIINALKKFWKIAGCNTMAVAPNGESLMYRHDVQRFTDKMLLGKETYFD